MSHVYVLVEHDAGQLNPVTAELISAANRLGVVSAVVVGGYGAELAEQLGQLGAVQVVDVSAPDYAERLIIPEVEALQILGEANPAPIFIASTATGNEIAGRLAVRLNSGVLSGVTDINNDRTAKHEIFGGSIDITSKAHGPCPVITLRPGNVVAQPQPVEATVAPMALNQPVASEVNVDAFTPAVKSTRPELTVAKTVVAGGRGVGDEFSTIVEPLADVLGGAVGATRDVVDDGFYDKSAQIGQTGVTVSPDLYIGLGISGAIQHTTGMQTAGTIVVINQDQDEPFFEIADLGVVGDVHEIAPALIAELNSRA